MNAHAIRGRRGAVGALATLSLGAALLLAPAPSRSQSPSEPPARAEPDDKRRIQGERRLELEGLEGALRRSLDARSRLEAEIDSLRADRARLTQALVESGAAVRRAETRLGEIETRLAGSRETERALRASLDGRRALLAEVLAVLQRMGRRPPPAVLVRPEDILQAVRASIMLGAVLPELRAETEALATDLAELVRVRGLVAAEQEARREEAALLEGERERLAALVEARRVETTRAERAAREEARKAQELAARADDLRDLVARLDAEVAAAERAAERARQEAERKAAAARAEADRLAKKALEEAAKLAEKEREEARRAADKARADAEALTEAARRQFAEAQGREAARISPRVAFQHLRGALNPPVSGVRLRAFGEPDGAGGEARGVSFAARPGAVVTAPADGWVVYAGAFRSFGQLLIINAGGGYHIVLAGMERIDVAAGQFVVSGEPVAGMGSGNVIASAALGAETAAPVLYVEFRKDGASFDPAPWWTNARAEKVRG